MKRDERVTRSFSTKFNQVRESTQTDERIIEGYFSLYENETKLYDGIFEIISKGAFSETLNRDIRGLWNHQSSMVIGRTSNSTLELKEDDKGLFARIKLPKTTYADDLLELIKEGYVNQCSFGFEIDDEIPEELANGDIRWRINKVTLHEVSVVTFPAYEDTTVSAREKDLQEMKTRKFETVKVKAKQKLEGLKKC